MEEDRIQVFLDAIPDSRMLVLNMFSEARLTLPPETSPG